MAHPRLTRQLWGLTARCERAIRSIAPHWRAQASTWGETEVLFDRLLLPIKWLCQAHQEMASAPFPPAALRLLTSSVATAAKAVQLTGIDPSLLFEVLAVQLAQATAVSLPAVATLLLPRIGAATATLPEGLFKLVATMSALDCGIHLVAAVDPGGPSQRPSSQATSTHVLRTLSSCHVSVLIQQLVSQAIGGAEHKPKAAALYLRGVAHLAIGCLSDYGRMMVSELWCVVEATLGDGGEAAAAALPTVPGEAILGDGGEAIGDGGEAILGDGGEAIGDGGEAILGDGGEAAAAEAAAAAAALPTASGLSSPEGELRNLLRWTISSLLASPLLDFLAGVQHILVEAGPSTQGWSFPKASFLPEVHHMPESMDDDALEPQVAMQVGGSGQCIHRIYRSQWSCRWGWIRAVHS